MISVSQTIIDAINSPARTIKGRVEIFKGSTLAFNFSSNDSLKSFTVARAGEESKFFGFGICQELELHLLDKERAIALDKGDIIKVYLGTSDEYIAPYPNFYISDISRDENTNELTIKAKDGIAKANELKVMDIDIWDDWMLPDFLQYASEALGAAGVILPPLSMAQAEKGNLDGSEGLRGVFNAVAEITQTIYLIKNYGGLDYLVFLRLDKESEPLLTITKNKYFELKTQAARTLSKLISATELGDNLEVGDTSGETQYIRDNPFWTLKDSTEVAFELESALNVAAGTTITPYSCDWRGDFTLELGDKIALITKDDSAVITYLLNETVEYNGALHSQIQWTYEDKAGETASNPVTLGEKLNQTFARVDKVNQEIELVVSQTSANDAAISTLQVNTDSISASVTKMESSLEDSLETMSASLEALTKEVSAKVDAEGVKIAIETELQNGVDKVNTTTGYTFDENGLNISKSDSEISTTISENGMAIYKNNTEVLTANNQGVKAEDLHATTYLLIGKNSRFEDYSSGARTGCFWIGG